MFHRQKDTILPLNSSSRRASKGGGKSSVSRSFIITLIWLFCSISVSVGGYLHCRSKSRRTTLECDKTACTYTSAVGGSVVNEQALWRSQLARAELLRINERGHVTDVSRMRLSETRKLWYSYGVVYLDIDAAQLQAQDPSKPPLVRQNAQRIDVQTDEKNIFDKSKTSRSGKKTIRPNVIPPSTEINKKEEIESIPIATEKVIQASEIPVLEGNVGGKEVQEDGLPTKKVEESSENVTENPSEARLTSTPTTEDPAAVVNLEENSRKVLEQKPQEDENIKPDTSEITQEPTKDNIENKGENIQNIDKVTEQVTPGDKVEVIDTDVSGAAGAENRRRRKLTHTTHIEHTKSSTNKLAHKHGRRRLVEDVKDRMDELKSSLKTLTTGQMEKLNNIKAALGAGFGGPKPKPQKDDVAAPGQPNLQPWQKRLQMSTWDLGRGRARAGRRALEGYIMGAEGEEQESFVLEESQKWNALGMWMMILGGLAFFFGILVGDFSPTPMVAKSY